VDVDILSELVPKITEVMRSVNLGSRVACAHLVILLAHQLGKSMENYTGIVILFFVGTITNSPGSWYTQYLAKNTT